MKQYLIPETILACTIDCLEAAQKDFYVRSTENLIDDLKAILRQPDEIKFRIQNADGTFLNAGTDNPSWFTLDKAREYVNYGAGQMIVEHNGEKVLWEIF